MKIFGWPFRSALVLFACLASFSTPCAFGQNFETLVYEVAGRIDGTDYLIIRGDSLQWHHPANSAAAVGRQGGGDSPTMISASVDNRSLLEDFEWTPIWPLAPPAEIRFDAYSSIFESVPKLDGEIQSVVIEKISGRGSAAIEQLPTPFNDNTLIVKYTDGGNGAAFLDARITVLTSVPEPMSCALMLLIAGAALTRRRRPPIPALPASLPGAAE